MTTTEEIVATIYKFQAMSYFLKSNTPGLNPPTTQTTNYAVAAQQVKCVSFTSDTQNKIPGWAQNLENKLSDQMTKPRASINSHMTDIEMTAMMKDMMMDMTDMMVTNQDIVMVIEKKEIEIMKTMVLIERVIDLPVDMTLGNQKGIQIALKSNWRKIGWNCPKFSQHFEKCQQTFKQIKKELCAERLPVNSYCPIQTPIDQNIFAVNADNFSCRYIFSYVVIFQIMSQSTSFLMRKYRTCSLIIIREKHSLRKTVRWAQKTLFRVKLAHLMWQSSNI